MKVRIVYGMQLSILRSSASRKVLCCKKLESSTSPTSMPVSVSRWLSKCLSTRIYATITNMAELTAVLLQVITKLLYLLCQGETFSKVTVELLMPWIGQLCNVFIAARFNTCCMATERSIRGVLQCYKAVSKQGCKPTPHGLPCDQGCVSIS